MSFNEFNEEWSNILQIQNKSKFVFTLIQGYKNACKIFMFKWGLDSSQFYQLLAENLCENWISRQNALCATKLSFPYPQLIDSPIFQSALLLKRTFQSTFFIHYFQLIFLHTFKRKKNALKNSDYLTPAIASCMMDGCLKRPFDL